MPTRTDAQAERARVVIPLKWVTVDLREGINLYTISQFHKIMRNNLENMFLTIMFQIKPRRADFHLITTMPSLFKSDERQLHLLKIPVLEIQFSYKLHISLIACKTIHDVNHSYHNQPFSNSKCKSEGAQIYLHFEMLLGAGLIFVLFVSKS